MKVYEVKSSLKKSILFLKKEDAIKEAVRQENELLEKHHSCVFGQTNEFSVIRYYEKGETDYTISVTEREVIE